MHECSKACAVPSPPTDLRPQGGQQALLDLLLHALVQSQPLLDQCRLQARTQSWFVQPAGRPTVKEHGCLPGVW
jgi:hypothetical protein